MSDPMTTIEGDRADVRVGHYHEGIMVSVGQRPKNPGDATNGHGTFLTIDKAKELVGALLGHITLWEED